MKIPFNDLSFKILTDEDLTSFSCGDPEIDDFLHSDAKEYQKNRLATTYLVFYQGNLVGFFSLAAGCIRASEVEDPPGHWGFQPKTYPAMKIAQIATCADYQNRGVGKHMLTVAFAVALNLYRYIGCRVVILDSKKDDKILDFYRKHGNFEAFGKGNGTIPLMRDLKKIVVDDTVNSDLFEYM